MKPNFTPSALAAAFKASDKRNGDNTLYRFWDMAVGQQCVVRFLPDANPDNPLAFLKEKITHRLTIDGKPVTVPCLTMYGEQCPICKVSSDYYKAGDKINGKRYWKSKQHLARVLIVSDPLPADDNGENCEGKVMNIAISYQIFNIIKEAFESGDLENVPFAFEGGTDFVIKKTQQGEYASYAVGTKFRPKPRDLDESEVALVEDSLIDLATLLPKQPELADVQRKLNADMTGESLADDEEEDGGLNFKPKAAKAPAKAAPRAAADDGDDDEDYVPPAPKKPAKPQTPAWEEEEDAAPALAAKKPAAKPAPAPADDDDDSTNDEADQILAQIRARKAAAKAS